MTQRVTRFAPSPNGYLHLGHAFSALVGYHAAQENGGRFLLRIEDIDIGRARPEFEQAIYDDLAWLGLEWETPVRRQSEHFADYKAAMEKLVALDVTYPCFCTRKEIVAAGGVQGPEGLVYPGTCRHMAAAEVKARRAKGEISSLRIDTAKAQALLSSPLIWQEEEKGEIIADPTPLGDIVLARKDIPTSYHVAVVVDDALQGITQVTRGLDLYEATPIHRLLQELLGLPVPIYHHHRLITDEAGQRLAKSKGSPTLRDLRLAGVAPQEIISAIGL